MRKLTMLAAMLAMALVAAAPAMAQVIQQETGGQAAESGDVEQEASVSNSGDNVNLCAAILNAANTGNVQNAQAVAQYFSEGDVEVDGNRIEVSPALTAECEQTIDQAVAAANGDEGSKAESGGAKAESKGGEAKGGGAEAKAGGAEAEASGGSGDGGGSSSGGGSSAKAQLPATGGASLFALGAGALLIGGGLVARKLTR